MTILITGGLGFIGRNFIKKWNTVSDEKIVCIDSNRLKNLAKCKNWIEKNSSFHQLSIGDRDGIKNILKIEKPRAVVNFAADSHVDYSIATPSETIRNNVIETTAFLDEIKNHFTSSDCNRENFQFLQISTDEVYGSAELNHEPFKETDILSPQNPYSASKAACEHILESFGNTYGISYKISRCSNNFGPFQSNEKFIPTVINCFLKLQKIPVYGDGLQVRDWLFVDDHIEALFLILDLPHKNICLNIGSNNELTNLQVIESIATIFNEIRPLKTGSYLELIETVQDRLGHDRRYSINPSYLKSLTSWNPKIEFENGLRSTISNYISEGA